MNICLFKFFSKYQDFNIEDLILKDITLIYFEFLIPHLIALNMDVIFYIYKLALIVGYFLGSMTFVVIHKLAKTYLNIF